MFDDVKSTFEVLRVERPSRREFEERFLFPQRPVIISGAMEGWPARERWTNDYLGSKSAPATIREAHQSSRPEKGSAQWGGVPPMKLAEYIDLLAGGAISDGNLYAALCPSGPPCPSSGPMSVFPPSSTRTSTARSISGSAPATPSPLSITTPPTTSSRRSAAEQVILCPPSEITRLYPFPFSYLTPSLQPLLPGQRPLPGSDPVPRLGPRRPRSPRARPWRDALHPPVLVACRLGH